MNNPQIIPKILNGAKHIRKTQIINKYHLLKAQNNTAQHTFESKIITYYCNKLYFDDSKNKLPTDNQELTIHATVCVNSKTCNNRF